MINKLFRLQFDSNTTPFIVFLALNGFLCFMMLNIRSVNGRTGLAHIDYHIIVIWLLIFCLVAATLALLRHNRERRCRLYAQLPVSPRDIRLAYWCLAGLYLFISTCVLVLVIVLAGITPVMNVFMFAALYFFNAGMLLGILSIVTSNNLPLIPEEIRQRTIPYFFLAALLTFLALFLLGLLVGFYTHLIEDGTAKWPLLTGLVTLACLGLVALDVRLFQRKDNYLG